MSMKIGYTDKHYIEHQVAATIYNLTDMKYTIIRYISVKCL